MHRQRKVLAILPFLLAGLVACAADPAAESADPEQAAVREAEDLTALPPVQVDEQLAQLVPADVRSAGLTVATSSTLPPMTYIADDSKTPIGFDVDVSHAIGKLLGVDTEVRTVGFDTLIPGLAAGRYSMALSSLGVTAERLKTVDFVSYYRGGQGFLASADSDFEVKDLQGLCGRRVAVGSGSVQESTLQEEEVDLCAKAGLEPWTVQVFPDLNAGVLAIRSGRADVAYSSISIVAYTADQNDELRVAGTYKRATVGVALPKDSPMTPVAQRAVQELIDDGTYKKILDKWGLEGNAIDTAEVNTVTPAS